MLSMAYDRLNTSDQTKVKTRARIMCVYHADMFVSTLHTYIDL